MSGVALPIEGGFRRGTSTLVREGDALLNEGIVALMAFIQIAYGFPALKIVQTGGELLLLSVLGLAIWRFRFDGWELLLMWLFGAVTVLSFFANPFDVFLTDAKIYGLAILALLYFSKVHFRSRLIVPVIAVNLLMALIWRIAPGVLMPLVNASRTEAFNVSRFGGLFLNAHYTAYVLAVPFIYYAYGRWGRTLLGGFAIFWASGSKFVLASYAANALTRLRLYQKVARHPVLFGLLIAASLYGLWIVQDRFIGMFDTRTLASAYVILQQLFDPRFYFQYLTNPLPADATYAAAEGLKIAHWGLMVGNEVALFTMYIQGGFLLTTLYLAILLRRTPYYRVFIVVSILHYGFVTNTFVLYLLLTFSRELKWLREAEPQATAAAAGASRPPLPNPALAGP